MNTNDGNQVQLVRQVCRYSDHSCTPQKLFRWRHLLVSFAKLRLKNGGKVHCRPTCLTNCITCYRNVSNKSELLRPAKQDRKRERNWKRFVDLGECFPKSLGYHDPLPIPRSQLDRYGHLCLCIRGRRLLSLGASSFLRRRGICQASCAARCKSMA